MWGFEGLKEFPSEISAFWTEGKGQAEIETDKPQDAPWDGGPEGVKEEGREGEEEFWVSG